jgi:hypothetical protein
LHLLVAGLPEIEIRFGGALALLLETVQDIHSVADGGHIEDPESTAASRILISRQPAPTLVIGFQSDGSIPA